MVFSFKDGSQLEVEPSKSHSFIQHDLAWATVARGGLTHISYQSGDRANAVRNEDSAAAALPAPRIESCKSCRL
jgi:hypothetical protein